MSQQVADQQMGPRQGSVSGCRMQGAAYHVVTAGGSETAGILHQVPERPLLKLSGSKTASRQRFQPDQQKLPLPAPGNSDTADYEDRMLAGRYE